YDPQRFCRDLLDHVRNLTVLRVTGDRQLLAELPEAEAEALTAQAERRSADDLHRFFRLLLEADEVLAAPARTVDPQLVLEMAVLRLATLPPLLPVDEILRRLEALGAGSAGGDVAAGSPAAPKAVKAQSGERLWEQFLARGAGPRRRSRIRWCRRRSRSSAVRYAASVTATSAERSGR